MNRTQIEWVDYTNNPVTGCRRLCRDSSGRIYCFAYYMAQRQRGRNGYPLDEPFSPTLHFDKLIRPDRVKKPVKVFSTSMGDLFDSGVPNVWRYLVFNAMRYNPHHTFIMLTKRVDDMVYYFQKRDWDIPENLWLGISQDGLTTQDDDIEWFRTLDNIPRKFVSFEPLLGPICTNLYGLDWIIIGAQTGPRAKQPRSEWIHDLLLEASSWDIPVFLKNNVKWEGNTRRPQKWLKA